MKKTDEGASTGKLTKNGKKNSTKIPKSAIIDKQRDRISDLKKENRFLKERAMEELNLRKLNISIGQAKRMLAAKKPRLHPVVLSRYISDKVFTFGVVSDTHFCSNKQKINELHTFYEVMDKEGIKDVVNAGDLVAGWGVYRGQENEVDVFGSQNQADYVAKYYPKFNGITHFITGNHDLSWLTLGGADIGKMIASQRPDMKYLGQYQGDLLLNNVKVRLMHPDGGGSYALSYRAQKISEQIPSGEKPQILIFGHWHTSHYFFYRNIHILNAGCFEGQTLFLARKGINPTIGGWTVEVRLEDEKTREKRKGRKNGKDTILSVRPTFIPFIS